MGGSLGESNDTTMFPDFIILENSGTMFCRTSDGDNSLHEDFGSQIFRKAIPTDVMPRHMHRLKILFQDMTLAAHDTFLC
jgi:hypothetical protein